MLTQKQLEASLEFWRKALGSLRDDLKLDRLDVEIDYDLTGLSTDYILIMSRKMIYGKAYGSNHRVLAGAYQSLASLKDMRDTIINAWARLDAEIQQQAVHEE